MPTHAERIAYLEKHAAYVLMNEAEKRRLFRNNYPLVGTGIRQGVRLARQKLDFSASERCIAKIPSTPRVRSDYLEKP